MCFLAQADCTMENTCRHTLIIIMKQSNSILTDSILPPAQEKPDKAPNSSFMVNILAPVGSAPLLPFFTMEGLASCPVTVSTCLIMLQDDSKFTYFPSLPYPWVLPNPVFITILWVAPLGWALAVEVTGRSYLTLSKSEIAANPNTKKNCVCEFPGAGGQDHGSL